MAERIPELIYGKGERICGSGPMADMIRSFPWTATALGPIVGWPPELVTMVNMMLSSSTMTVIYWGAEMRMIYNDAYVSHLADKHSALGRPLSEVWSEIYVQIGEIFREPFHTGLGFNMPTSRYFLLLDGHLVEKFYAVSGYPIWIEGPDGTRVGGVYQTGTDQTEGVLAAARLKDSEAQASRVLDSIGEAVIVTSAAAQITRINPVAQELTGWTEKAALGQPLSTVFQVVPETTGEAMPGTGGTAFSTGSIHLSKSSTGLDHGTSLLTRGGKRIAVDRIAAPIYDEDGHISGGVLVFRDIEERRSAERLRDRLTDQLQQIMAATSDGIATLDREWNFAFLNERGKDILHVDAQIIGRNVWEAYPAMIFEGSPYEEHYRRAMDQGIAGEFLAEYPAPLHMTLKIIARSLKDGILIIFRDVTEERNREKALQANEARFRAIFDGAPIGIAISNADGTLASCNRAYETLTGHTQEALRTMSFLDLTHDDHRDENRELFRQLIEGKIPHFAFEKRYLHADGSTVWVRSNGTLLRDEAGNPKVLGIIERIEERRLAEAALRQSEKIAAVGRLASSISHEINNPLEAVTNLLYLMRGSSELKEIHEYADIAERELRRVSLLTSQALRFHKDATAPAPFFCYDLIGDSLLMYQSRLVNARIVVEKKKRAEQPVECFGGDVRQVLSNLIGNAIDAMPMGGRLLVRSREAPNWKTGERGIVLTIADTGTGIAPATLKRIFEPFFTTKGIGGTGLGLWVATEIAARHRGALRVRSCQREGSCGTVFDLFLPLKVHKSR